MTVRRRREAGREDELVDLGFGHLLQVGLRYTMTVLESALALIALGVETAAIVGDADDDVAALVIGGQADGALLGLAGTGALGRRLQAMVGGVAHHVGERILDQVEHLPIELGIGAVHLQFDLLAEFADERSRTILGSFCQALPIGCMRVFMTPSCNSAVTLERRCSGTLNSVSSLRRDDLQELVAGQHQLGDHGHEVFEGIDVDADRLVGDLVGFGDGHVGLRRPMALRAGLALTAGAAGLRRGRGLGDRGSVRRVLREQLQELGLAEGASRGRRARLRRDAARVPAPGRPSMPDAIAGCTGGAATTGAGSGTASATASDGMAAFGHARASFVDQVFDRFLPARLSVCFETGPGFP